VNPSNCGNVGSGAKPLLQKDDAHFKRGAPGLPGQRLHFEQGGAIKFKLEVLSGLATGLT